MFPKSMQYIFSFFPVVYINSYATNYLFGFYNNEIFFNLFLKLILIITIISILTYINWKIGLEKYEAFN